MDMSVWYLMGAALVFFMQCGFAMVEAGFTRSKNVGNITMKNLMDFCIGTVVFILIGFGLLLGEDLLGFIGKPGFDIFTSYALNSFHRVSIIAIYYYSFSSLFGELMERFYNIIYSFEVVKMVSIYI